MLLALLTQRHPDAWGQLAGLLHTSSNKQVAHWLRVQAPRQQSVRVQRAHMHTGAGEAEYQETRSLTACT